MNWPRMEPKKNGGFIALHGDQTQGLCIGKHFITKWYPPHMSKWKVVSVLHATGERDTHSTPVYSAGREIGKLLMKEVWAGTAQSRKWIQHPELARGETRRGWTERRT